MQVTGTGRIQGVTADLGDIGELVPVLTALAALADSPSVFTGVGHLRTHESDRLPRSRRRSARSAARSSSAATAWTSGPGRCARRASPSTVMTITGWSWPRRCSGLAVPGLTVQNAATVGKTFPAFTAAWPAMLEQSP